MRAAVYTRVSTEEQIEGFSLSAQMIAIERFAELREFTIVARYSDPGRSGRSAMRPDFQRMMRDAKDGLFDVIIVHKLDRFSRSLKDVLLALAELERYGVGFTSATEAFDYTTPSGKLMLSMLAAIAQWYIENLSLEVKKGKQERARQGEWNGRLSWGYTTPGALKRELVALGEQFKAQEISTEDYSAQCSEIESWLELYENKGDTSAIPDQRSQNGVALAFSLYATGKYSDQQIADQLNESGYRISSRTAGNLLGKETISDLLQNRFYIGETAYGRGVAGSSKRRKIAQYQRGAHEPLITQSLFDRVQEVRAERRKGHTTKGTSARVYPLTGRLVCLDCGHHLSGWTKEEKGYYRHKRNPRAACPNQVTVRSTMVETQIYAFLRGIRLPEDWRLRILAALGEVTDDQHDQLAERSRLENRLTRLAELYEYGDIEKDDYEQRRGELKLRIAEIDAAANIGRAADYESAARYMQDIGRLWKHGDASDRAILARNLFGKIYVRDGVLKAVEPTPVMWVLLTKGILLRGEQGTNPQWVTVVPPSTPQKTVLAAVGS